jgi:hypothetical protein
MADAPEATQAPTVPPGQTERGLLLLRQVNTFAANGQVPRRQWTYANPQQRNQYVNQVRATLLGILEAKFPNHFYDFVSFRVVDPPQDGSTIIMAADKTLQHVLNSQCVANIYAPAFVPPKANEREAFLEFARQALYTPDLEGLPEPIRGVVDKLADLWAQGLRPSVVPEGSGPA